MKLAELKGTHSFDDLDDEELIKDLQLQLNRIGYDLKVDGILGPKTFLAWAKFKKDRYLTDPDKIGDSSIKILLAVPTIEKARFFLPTNGLGWLSSPFGRRSRGWHGGVDLAANEGVMVYAVADGTVITRVSGCEVGNFRCGGGYGNVVYLGHNLKEFDESRYAHLSRLAAGIDTGTHVEKGALLGYVGNTGYSFGNHLHFELRKKAKAFNPLSIINPIV
ncbi:MAG: M23 family metallopeptidase [Xenococcaceae cyanobacterium]